MTLRAAAVATAASAAFPPWDSTASPAATARGWEAATIPLPAENGRAARGKGEFISWHVITLVIV